MELSKDLQCVSEVRDVHGLGAPTGLVGPSYLTFQRLGQTDQKYRTSSNIQKAYLGFPIAVRKPTCKVLCTFSRQFCLVCVGGVNKLLQTDIFHSNSNYNVELLAYSYACCRDVS